MFKKGIILAGGLGTRLYPLTKIISKQLLPVYDKPMIYYPLSILMKLKIKDINLISDKINLKKYKELLGSGKQFGINIKYSAQNKPKGIAQSILISEKFINKSNCVLILGDNIFIGDDFDKTILSAANKNISYVFIKKVSNPNRYGVLKFSKNKKKILQIVEKPKKFVSDFAVTGLYFYTKEVVEYAKKIKFSNRNELEITDLNNMYIRNNKMKANILSNKVKWFDAGTYDSLLEVGKYVETYQKQKKQKIAFLEKIAFKNKWITQNDIEKVKKKFKKNIYYKNLNIKK